VIDGNQLLIADSPKVFADKVARLLDDSALRERMGRSAREHVERYHSWEEIGSKFEEVYRSLAATGGGKTEMTSSAYFSKT